jgi:branched-chain amino acid transport system substrate-binding protein
LRALASFVAAAAVAVTAASAAPPPPPPPAAKIAACNTARIGFLGPLTGPYSAVGRDQLGWARLALDTFNAANGTHFTLRQADTRLVPKRAVRAASTFAADRSLLATIGPAGSQEVTAVGKVFTRARLPSLLSSATSVVLRGGAYPTFSRVVGSDTVQGRSDARFMIEKLHARKVLIVEDSEPYSATVAGAAAQVLRANGVQVVRRSVNQTLTDFSSLIDGISADTSVVFLPWQLASNAELFAQQMQDQGVSTKLLGSDAVDTSQFAVPGAYVSSFSRPIRGSLFGPPTYVAAQVIATAYKAACADGKATRAELLQAVRAVRIPASILGAPVTFDAHGEVPTARFYVSQIQSNGKHRLVW